MTSAIRPHSIRIPNSAILVDCAFEHNFEIQRRITIFDICSNYRASQLRAPLHNNSLTLNCTHRQIDIPTIDSYYRVSLSIFMPDLAWQCARACVRKNSGVSGMSALLLLQSSPMA